MLANKLLVLGLLASPVFVTHTPMVKVHCSAFDRCGWHRVDKVTHPVVAAVAHVVKQTGQLVTKPDQGVNDWWERVKHDWGPSINRGANHLLITTVTSLNNFLYHPCPSGTDKPYTDANGNTVHKCDGAAGAPSPPSAANSGVAGEQDGVPADPVVTLDGPKLFPRYCSKVPFAQTIEIYDVNAQAWVQRIFLPPDSCVSFGINQGADGHGAIVMRFFYHNGQEVSVQYLNDGDEFTV